MIVLGIETSGLEGSIALLKDGTSLGERRMNQVGRRHAQALVLEIGDLLRENDLAPHHVELVAVSRGPGSFTGLRVGMVCAKTFAYATECRFIAVDTFAALARNVPPEFNRVIVVEDAQRNELFAGEYVRDNLDNWKQVDPIKIISVQSFLSERCNNDVVTGPAVKKLDPNLATFLQLRDPIFTDPRAVAIATLGSQGFAQNHEDPASSDTDFWRASPFYLRMSAAEEKRAAIALNQGDAD